MKGAKRVKQVMKGRQKYEAKKRLTVVKLELDYELATLFEAMKENDEQKKKECIRKLEKLRNEWLRLKI
jgi:hypothetical protein